MVTEHSLLTADWLLRKTGMGRYFAIVNESAGVVDRTSHLCYAGNDEDMLAWKVPAGFKLVELLPEEYSALAVLDIVVNRNGKDEVIQAEDITDADQLQILKRYNLNPDKLTKFVEDRNKIDVPIEIDGIGGKEIIGYEQKPEGIVMERKKDIEIIKAKSELEK